jgi:hypothetical protein
MKAILTFICRGCSKPFTALGVRSHPVKTCPDCKGKRARLRNRENREYRAARHKRIYRLGSAPYEVVRHDDPAGFRPGARFSSNELDAMVKAGYVEGCVVKRADRKGGGVYVVARCELEEVKL